MYAVPAQPARLEAGRKIGDVARCSRIASGLFGQCQAQQQGIDAGAAGQQGDHLTRAVLVQQPVRPGALQIRIGGIHGPRPGKPAFGCRVAQAAGRLGGQRQRPQGDTGLARCLGRVHTQ